MGTVSGDAKYATMTSLVFCKSEILVDERTMA